MTSEQQPDGFRSLDHVTEPDARQAHFVVRERSTGAVRQRTIRDHHEVVEQIILNPEVPEDVRVHFDTARNILLYSWFVYRFIPVAEKHAYASVEMALREKFGLQAQKRPPKFREMFDRAVREGLIRDEGYRQFRRIRERSDPLVTLMDQLFPTSTPPPAVPPDVAAYSRTIAEIIPSFRNELAHGSSMIGPYGYLTLELCCDTINQLFPSRSPRPAQP